MLLRAGRASSSFSLLLACCSLVEHKRALRHGTLHRLTRPTGCSPVQLFLTEVLLFEAYQLSGQSLVLVLVAVYLGVVRFQPRRHRLWAAEGDKCISVAACKGEKILTFL